MTKLTEEQKVFIVKALACFDTPSQVAEGVKEEFGIDVSRQLCATYDPTKYVGRNLCKKWRTIFAATRKRFTEEVSDIPIASKAFRLRALGRIAERAGKNNILVMQALEQAAKESGGFYENRKPDNTPDIAPQPVSVTVNVVDASKAAAHAD